MKGERGREDRDRQREEKGRRMEKEKKRGGRERKGKEIRVINPWRACAVGLQ